MSKAATRTPVRQRRFIIFLFLLTLFLGFFSLERLPVDFLPSLNASHLRVQTSAPGLSAEVVDEKITQPLISVLSGVAEMTALESTSSAGLSILDVAPRHHRDIEALQREITTRMEPAQSILPSAIPAPQVSNLDESALAARLAVTSNQYDPLALRDWVETELARRLQELPGVAAVELKGGGVREIVIMPDQGRLAGLGLSFSDIIQAIQKGRDSGVPVSVLPRKTLRRRELMPLGNVASVAAMPVALPSGENLSLSEVAKIILKEQTRTDIFRVDGQEAVGINVHKQARVVRSQVAEHVQSHIDWMRANRLVPPGVEIHLLSKRLDQARQSLKKISLGFIGGLILALIAAYVLLGNRRQIFIIAGIVIASIFSIFILMALARLSLDAISLAGLALMSGLLGIGSLALFENNRRFSQQNKPVTRGSVVASVLSLPVSVMPFFFMNQEINLFFRDFIVMAISLWMLSVAWTLLIAPAFDARRRDKKDSLNLALGQILAQARQRYVRFMQAVLRRSKLALVLVLILAGAVTAVFFVKKPTDTPLPASMSEKVVLRLQGPDAKKLSVLADALVQDLAKVAGLRDIRHSAQTRQEDFVIHMDEVRAPELGIDIAEAGRALAIALNGISLGYIRDAERRYDIRLRLPLAETHTQTALGRILLRGESENQPAVYFRDVASLERKRTPAEIHRVNGIPLIELTASMTPSLAPNQVRAQIHAALKGFSLPQNYYLTGDGIVTAADSQGKYVIGLTLALFLIWLIQVLSHRSLAFATLVSLASLFAAMVTGATLFLFEVALSPSVWLGLALLLGLAAVHVVTLLAPLQDLPASEILSAAKIMQTIKHRLRPVGAMALMAVFGLTPLLFVDAAMAIFHPLIITLMVGISFSLLGNLLLMPLLGFFVFGKQEQTAVKQRL